MYRSVYILSFSCLMVWQMLAQDPYLRQQEWSGPMKGKMPRVIEQDLRGLTWVGSSEGLFYFDGARLNTVQWLDTSLLDKEPHVRSIHQDPNGTYWVGTQSGRIYRSGQIFKGLELWQPEEGLPKVPVIDLATDARGNLWFATYGEGLYVYDGNRLYNIDEFDGLPGVDVYDMVVDAEGCIWAGTDAGLIRCTFVDGEKKIEVIGVEQGLPDEIVTALSSTDGGHLWLGTHQKGVYRYDLKKGNFRQVAPSLQGDPIVSLSWDKNSLWIGSEHNGLLVYDGEHLHKVDYEGRPIERINDLLVDEEKNLWVLTETPSWWIGNLWFRHLNTPFTNIQAIHASKDGSLWLGTQSGLYHAVESEERWDYEKIPGIRENVISLYKDAFGILWVGTFGDGIICYDPRSGQRRYLTGRDGLINESILSIDGRNDTLWLATLGGVMEVYLMENILKGKNLKHSDYNHKNQLGTNYVYQVVADRNGRTYFATDGKGVSVLKNGELGWIARSDSIGKKVVYSVAVDQTGNIWFSTQKGLVYYSDGLVARPIVLPEAVYQKDVSSIIYDGMGRMLISYKEGIDLVETKTREIVHFDEDIGMKHFNPALNCHSRGQNGKIWIGHEQGVVCYTPYPEKRTIRPRIILPEISLYLEPINRSADQQFKHNQNHFTFEYLGLWYTDPEALSYRYMLEGYDLHWKTTKDRQALYSNLSPGSYTFKVQVTPNGGYKNAPTATYRFTIAKPIWARWWFIALVLMLIGGMIYFLVKLREKQLKKEENLKRETVTSQFETLKSQINPHFLFNSFNTLISVIEEEPDIAVQYVEKLSDFYRSILQYRERDLIGLDEELQLIEDYTYLLNMRYRDRLHIELPEDIPEQVHIAPLTLQILMENAIKHNVISRLKPLEISVSLNGDDFITVRNTLQQKITKERSTGFGLESIVNRYAVLSDRPVQIKRDGGQFIVKIPVIKIKKNERANR